jgi:nitrite reductase (NADH) small subunit
VTWTPVCRLAELVPERGVAALVDGEQVAVFRLLDAAGRGTTVVAVGHRDPFTGANVLARGIVGTRGHVPTVASPLHKQVFDLLTGACLDDHDVFLPTWSVRVQEGWVLIGPPREPRAVAARTMES